MGYESKESQELVGQFMNAYLADRQPVEICKQLADKLMGSEGANLRNIDVLSMIVSVYMEHGIKHQNVNSFQKAAQYAQQGIDLYEELHKAGMELNKSMRNILDITLGVSIFFNGLGKLGVNELEKVEFHLERAADSLAPEEKEILMDAKKRKNELTRFTFVVGPDCQINWDQAESWVKNLTHDGGGWRMPTLEELKAIYMKNKTRAMPWWIWSGEVLKDQQIPTAYCLDFRDGKVIGYECDSSNPRHRVIAVRGIL